MDEAGWWVDLYFTVQAEASSGKFLRVPTKYHEDGHFPIHRVLFRVLLSMCFFNIILQVLFRVHPGLASDAVNHVFANASSAENV